MTAQAAALITEGAVVICVCTASTPGPAAAVLKPGLEIRKQNLGRGPAPPLPHSHGNFLRLQYAINYYYDFCLWQMRGMPVAGGSREPLVAGDGCCCSAAGAQWLSGPQTSPAAAAPSSKPSAKECLMTSNIYNCFCVGNWLSYGRLLQLPEVQVLWLRWLPCVPTAAHAPRAELAGPSCRCDKLQKLRGQGPRTLLAAPESEHLIL